MSDLVNPYKNTIFYTRVKLLPYQMNNELYINLKNNLKKKVEKKCNKYGYINKVYKILSYSDGTINPEDFNASAVFDIKYSASSCIPVENTKIVVKIEKMNNMAILAKNGPIKVVLKYDKISPKFKVVQGTILYNNNQIKAGDYLTISILAKRFYNKDIFISVYGYIDDVPTEKQISDNYEPNIEDTELVDESNKFVEYVTFNDEDNAEENKSNMVIKETDFTKQSRILDI
jgi:DNA-directed RNA polymerase subunit E'/Rpb7